MKSVVYKQLIIAVIFQMLFTASLFGQKYENGTRLLKGAEVLSATPLQLDYVLEKLADTAKITVNLHEGKTHLVLDDGSGKWREWWYYMGKWRVKTSEDSGGSDYQLPPATRETLGGVMVGNGLDVAANGNISVQGNTMYVVLDASEIPENMFNFNLHKPDYPTVDNLNIYLKGATSYHLGMVHNFNIRDNGIFENINIYTLASNTDPALLNKYSTCATVIFDVLFLRKTNLHVACNMVVNVCNQSIIDYRYVQNSTINVEGNLTVKTGEWFFNTINVGETFAASVTDMGRGNIIHSKDVGETTPKSLTNNNLFIIGNGVISAEQP
jgi:hypothetical protein